MKYLLKLLLTLSLTACGAAYTLRPYQDPSASSASVIVQLDPNWNVDVDIHQMRDCSGGSDSFLGGLSEHYVGSMANKHQFRGRRLVEYNDIIKVPANIPIAFTASLNYPGIWHGINTASFLPKADNTYKLVVQGNATNSGGDITILIKNKQGEFVKEVSAKYLDERCTMV